MNKKKTTNHIHIGSIIKAMVKQQRISDVEFASMVHCHPSNLINMYKRHSINTELLWKISIALEYNFFTEIYGDELNQLLKNKPDYGTMNILISADKISVEHKKGTTRIVEYRKVWRKRNLKEFTGFFIPLPPVFRHSLKSLNH